MHVTFMSCAFQRSRIMPQTTEYIGTEDAAQEGGMHGNFKMSFSVHEESLPSLVEHQLAKLWQTEAMSTIEKIREGIAGRSTN